MDFSDILSYPSPSNNVCAQIQSSDLHTCQRYLEACAKLVNILSDYEIDIRSVHYKYRVERFLRSRSKTSRRFISTYEQRFPDLAIPKHQTFIYESNGNVKIENSYPTAKNKKCPPMQTKSSLLQSSSIVEENLSVPDSATTADKYLTGWTIAIYHPSVINTIEQQNRFSTPIPLPWIVKRAKNDSVVCDLRRLYYICEEGSAYEYDLSPLFIEDKPVPVSPIYEESSELSPLRLAGNERFRACWNLLFVLVLIVCLIVTVTAVGMSLSLLCYASIGVLINIHHVALMI